MTTKRLLIYGDVEMDILLKTNAADPLAQDVSVETLSFSPGGSAANCAAIAGGLGQPITFLGSLGSDSWTEQILADFRKFKVNTDHVKGCNGKTGTCVAVVDALGERKFYSYRGVNETDPPEIPPDSVWQKHHGLHLSGYSFQQPKSRATALALVRQAKAHGLAVSLDPSYLFAKNPPPELDELLPEVDFLFPNRIEAALLSGKDDPLEAARALRARGVKTVLVTLGAEGCLVSSDGVEEFINIRANEIAIDTTGAGDAFCGGFLTAWLGGLSMVQSAKLGCAAAAHIVTRIGAHEHAPTWAELLNLLRQNMENELTEVVESIIISRTN